MVLDAVFTDLNIQNLPDNVTAGFTMVIRIAMLVFGFILLLPQTYIGIRGIKLSKKPDSSTAHIVWAVILTVFAVTGIFSPISEMMQGGNIAANLLEAFDMAIDIALYISYVVFAKQVHKAA